MKPDARHALVHALEKGVLEVEDESTIGFFNAAPLPDVPLEWRASIRCEQANRVTYNQLVHAGFQVSSAFENSEAPLKGALVLLGRNRRVNENRIARAWNACEAGGRLVVAGDKTSGVNPLRKWFGSQCELTGSLSKFHAVVFWADKQGGDLESVSLQKSVDGYVLGDGMFSASGPDVGSKLLVEHFSDRIRGRVADLGAGWGYLSANLLATSPRVEELDMFEADSHALEAARTNLAGIKDTVAPKQSEPVLNFHWLDVTSEFKKTPYDWVIMNPPFHTGRAAEPDLGKRFIEVAASTLPSGGRLLMVANRNLPYEKTLELKFRRHEKLEERDGFKVIEAVK